MNVLIAMDSFKGTFSSVDVAALVESGIISVFPNALVDVVSIADGGEGTLDAVFSVLGGSRISVSTSDPLGRPITAHYIIAADNTAIIETSEAAGLCLLALGERTPSVTSTFGVGEIIKDAMCRNCKRIILGIGGSATNDGGTGMARALGFRFFDINNKEISDGGIQLNKLSKIDSKNIDEKIKSTEFIVACDVDNPLFGSTGASMTFGFQKGGNLDELMQLDRNLMNLSEVIERDLEIDVKTIAGGGAAGGLGAGLYAFCGAKLTQGIDVIMDIIDIDARMLAADIVVTGEGRLDGQTIHGKVPVGIAGRAKKYGKPVFAITGYAGEGAEEVYKFGIDAVLSAVVSPVSLEQAIKDSAQNITAASERLFRIIRAVLDSKIQNSEV